MIIHVKFTAITGKVDPTAKIKVGETLADVAKKELENALYGHTKIEEFMDRGDGRFAAILRTESVRAEDAEYFAEYQADRLQSFGGRYSCGAQNVRDNPHEALERLQEMV